MWPETFIKAAGISGPLMQNHKGPLVQLELGRSGLHPAAWAAPQTGKNRKVCR